ncbi:MAG: peptidoglycan-binding protein, partial [Oscillospiraceae bacterium]|nr:peptidoglycan-binding protein [Oscillospiraceae bacterium]
ADAGFVECFGLESAAKLTYQPVGGFSAACRYSAQFYKNAGAWTQSPEAGDQIFLYVDGGINHTGIVTAVTNGCVYTVEGNSGDMVARRVYALRSPNIAGYGRPNWSAVGKASPSPSPPAPVASGTAGTLGTTVGGERRYAGYEYSVKIPLLRSGNSGPAVFNLQTLLSAHGFDCGSADGVFGPKTCAALTAFQRKAGLDADGEFGGQSFTALWDQG